MQVIKMGVWDLINTVRSPQFQQVAKYRFRGDTVMNPDIDFHGIGSLNDIDTILNKEVYHSNEVLQHSRTFDIVSSVSGSVVNIDAYLNGEPEDMYTFVNSESNTVEDLNLYISLSWKVPLKDIAAAAQRIKAYVESRPANISLNINVRSDYRAYNDKPRAKNRLGSESYSIQLLVASADDYLTDQVVNLLGHPMFYRYFMLRHRGNQLNMNSMSEPCPPDYINFLTFNKTW